MTWVDRLRSDIQLTSPSGAVFNPLWQRDPRRGEKSLGIFKYPKVRGAVVQDMEIGPIQYPLTLAFEGENNDLEADRFFNACAEWGLWEIVHPVRGALVLQLARFEEIIDPVTSGNVTIVRTDWLEPLTDQQLPSVPELRGRISNQINVLNESSADQLLANVSQVSSGEISAFQTTVNSVVAAVSNTLENISEFNAEVNSQVASIRRGINDALAVIPMDILSIAGQIQALAQLPALAISDVEARLDAYERYAAEVFNFSLTRADLENRNIVAVQELALVAGLGAFAQISSTGTVLSRMESIEIIERNSAMLNDIINVLDASQEIFTGTPIDVQFFSQSNSFPSSALLTAQTVAYLLQNLYSLSIEKRFVLKKRRAPIEITITEYGDLGPDDSNFDLFITTNNLSGNEIIILEAGTEVVVYV